jgi:transcriptional regulator with XRE-family HTH domain
MSELGNRIRSLREDLSQPAFARKVGLSLRTICKLEAGEPASLRTIERIARSSRLSEGERLNLIVAWLKLELGEDFQKLSVEIKDHKSVSLKDEHQLAAKIQVLISDIPRKQQEQVCLALQRPEVLGCLATLNALYDSLKGTSR